MSLRRKTLLIVGITIVFLHIILLYSANHILLRGFTALEEADMFREVKSVQKILDAELLGLDKFLYDWASWDDTYQFITDRNNEYLQRNITASTLMSQNLNFILYLNLQGDLIYGQGYNHEKKEMSALPNGLIEYIAKQSFLAKHTDKKSAIKGLIMLPDGPVMIASRPILDSVEEEPIRGTMIVGRYLDDGCISEIAQIAQLPIRVERYDNLDNIKNSFVQVVNMEEIAGYLPVNDIFGNPILLLRFDKPRIISQQGQKTIHYLVSAFAVIGIFFGFVILFFLKKNVLDRIMKLSQEMGKIGKKRVPSDRVEVEGKDELTYLAKAVNSMLYSLELIQNELQMSEAVTGVLLESFPDSLLRINSDGKIIDFKTGRNRIAATPPLMLAGRNIREIYPSQIAECFMEKIRETLDKQCQQIYEYELHLDSRIVYQEIRFDACGDNEVLAVIRDYDKYR